MKRVRKLFLWVALIALGFFLRDAFSLIRKLQDGYTQLCSLKMPGCLHDAHIDVYGSNDGFSPSRGLFYEVRTGGQLRIPMAYFGNADWKRKLTESSFVLFTAKDGYLVGVASAATPKEIVLIHDFTTDETWPKAGYAEHFSSTRRRGETLLAVLRADSGRPDLQLAELASF